MRGVISVSVSAVLTCAVVAGAAGQGADKPWLSPGTRVGEEIIGPDGGTMVWVPPGSFMMGAADDDVRYAVGKLEAPEGDVGRDRPAHEVRITEGFWLGKHEVTNAQYRAFCDETGNTLPEYSTEPDGHPVLGLTWAEAVAYCKHAGLVMPTEAQWEYAARGAENRWYPWGNFWESSRCCYRNRKGPNGKTFPAGSFPEGASWCGALDMAGSAHEWCQDWYDRLYYEESPNSDPTGPATGEYRVLRGGCFGDLPWACRSAFRGRRFPDERDYAAGLRVCITP